MRVEEGVQLYRGRTTSEGKKDRTRRGTGLFWGSGRIEELSHQN